MENNDWDFGSPEEIQEALERNKKLAENGFEIREAAENEPTPIIERDSSELPDIKEVVTSEDIDFDYVERYWAMFDIVNSLVEEIKFLKKAKDNKGK
jgi:hypothetical protein